MHTIRSTHAYLFSVLRDFGLPSSWTEPYHIMNTIINHETAIMGHILSKKVSCTYVRGNTETMRGTTNIYLNIVSLFRLNLYNRRILCWNLAKSSSSSSTFSFSDWQHIDLHVQFKTNRWFEFDDEPCLVAFFWISTIY